MEKLESGIPRHLRILSGRAIKPDRYLLSEGVVSRVQKLTLQSSIRVLFVTTKNKFRSRPVFAEKSIAAEQSGVAKDFF